MEVALLDDAVLERDLVARQRRGQRHHHRALDLRFHRLRVDAEVTVHACGHGSKHRLAVLALAAHPGFDDICHHRLEALVHRHAPGGTGRQPLLAVAALFHRELQRFAVPPAFVALHQRHPVSHRVLLRRHGNLVDQRFHDKTGVRRADRAPPQHRHVVLWVVHCELHGQVVRFTHAFGGGTVNAVLDQKTFEGRPGDDALADDAVVPAKHLALGVEADLSVVHGEGTVVAGLHVVFAAPDHLDRCPLVGCGQRLGHARGFAHPFAHRRGAAAEAATGHLHLDLNLLGLEADDTGHRPSIPAWHLRGSDHRALVGLQIHGAGQRLHLRVVKVGEHEIGADLHRRRGDGADVGLEVLGWRLLARGFGQRLVLGEQLHGVHLLDRAGVPIDLERIPAHLRRPVAVGYDRDALAAAVKRYGQHGLHALDLQRLRAIEALHLTVEHRRTHDHRGQHARQLDVHTVLLRAGALGARDFEACRLADDLEVLRVLERHLLGYRLLHRGVKEFAVGGALAAAADRAVGHREPRRRHAELLASGGQ